MNLLRILPRQFLSYNWQEPRSTPYDPTVPVLFPKSRHSWLQIGDLSDGAPVPSGTQVAGTPLDLDGTRGILTLWAEWFKGLGGTNNYIQIALLDSAGPDAVPALFAQNPTNRLAGRTYVFTSAGEPVASVAASMAPALSGMLAGAGTGIDSRFAKGGGAFVANYPRADLGDGTFVIISPTPWRSSELQSESGVWAADMPSGDITAHPGTFRPEFLAGVRPAPWLVVGQPSAGLGEEFGPIG